MMVKDKQKNKHSAIKSKTKKPQHLDLLPKVGYKLLETMLEQWKETTDVPKKGKQCFEVVSRFHLELMLHLIFSYGYDGLMEKFQSIDDYVHNLELEVCQREMQQAQV